jgi:hypothetical protein
MRLGLNAMAIIALTAAPAFPGIFSPQKGTHILLEDYSSLSVRKQTR